jgi:hypothetical protein
MVDFLQETSLTNYIRSLELKRSYIQKKQCRRDLLSLNIKISLINLHGFLNIIFERTSFTLYNMHNYSIELGKTIPGTFVILKTKGF